MNNCELKKLLPVDKFDTSSMPTLIKLSEDEIKPILPELILWTADLNWPIAPETIKILVKFSSSTVPIIRNILSPTETDEEFKWSIIVGLVPELTKESQECLIRDIKRIVDSPTDSEIASEVWEAAKNYAEQH